MALGSITLMIVASLSYATPAAAQQSRVSVRVAGQDSLLLLRGELQRLVLAQEALVRDIKVASNGLRRAASDAEKSTFRARVSELSGRLERTLNAAQMLQAHLREVCAEQPAPDGWLGIHISQTGDITASPSATAFFFSKYPTLVSVEPGSPAQKAGLASGDEILALGGRDLGSGALDIAVLLKPGLSLPVRYRRDGEIRTVNVRVEPRPEGFNSNCPWIEIDAAPVRAQARSKIRVVEMPNGRFNYVFVDSAAPKVMERTQARAAPVLPPTAHVPFRLQGTISGANTFIGGAILMPLSEALREGLDVEEGMLVVDVLRGSPALDAGLRAGDVITRINGQKIQSALALLAVLDGAGGPEVELQVSRRNAKPRTVRLRR